MKNESQKKWLKIAGVVVVGWTCIWLFRQTVIGHMIWPPRRVHVVSDGPCIATPGPYRRGVRMDLYVRPVLDDEDAILITRGFLDEEAATIPQYWPVFRYKRAAGLSLVESAEWADGGEPVTYANPAVMRAGPIYVGQRDDLAVWQVGFEEHAFAARARYAIWPKYGQGGTLVSVLTADGPRRPSSGPGMVFGSFGGGFYGQHYFEFFEPPEMKSVGEPVRIPFSTIEGIESWVWSADCQFIVVSDADGSQICVLDVPKKGRQP